MQTNSLDRFIFIRSGGIYCLGCLANYIWIIFGFIVGIVDKIILEWAFNKKVKYGVNFLKN